LQLRQLRCYLLFQNSLSQLATTLSFSFSNCNYVVGFCKTADALLAFVTRQKIVKRVVFSRFIFQRLLGQKYYVNTDVFGTS